MEIRGMKGMDGERLQFELLRGGKFVLYYYCISVLIITFRRPSPVYFIRAEESAVVKGLPWTLLTLVAGLWGIPWGPIYTVQSLIVNLNGGKDVTAELQARLVGTTGYTGWES
jgi:hypothetical protein